jgi:hypothetical protein
MTPGIIQDPKGANTLVLSFKTKAGAIAAIYKQTYKIAYFGDAVGGVLRVDTTAIAGNET